MVRNLVKNEIQTKLSCETQSVKVSWVPSVFSILEKYLVAGGIHPNTPTQTNISHSILKNVQHTADKLINA